MFIVDRMSHLDGRFRLAQVATLRILIGLIGESVCRPVSCTLTFWAAVPIARR